MAIDTRGDARRRTHPIAVFVGTLIGALVLHRILGEPDLPITRHVEGALGTLGILLGGAILFSAVAMFREAGADPWRGTPPLLTEGIYARTRNPMLLGLAIAYAGIAVMLDSAVVLLVLVPLMIVLHREVVEDEERELEHRFGERYALYRSSVRRWI